jgi:hypothetical protein
MFIHPELDFQPANQKGSFSPCFMMNPNPMNRFDKLLFLSWSKEGKPHQNESLFQAFACNAWQIPFFDTLDLSDFGTRTELWQSDRPIVTQG